MKGCSGMEIKRIIQVADRFITVSFDLTDEELEEAYDTVLKKNTVKDLIDTIDSMDEIELYGLSNMEVINNEVLMEKIYERFLMKQDSNISYWENIVSAIKYVLENRKGD
jgi:hypothetical protein